MSENETVYYTIGILGISDVCEYSLTAIQNSFQIYEPEFSKVYTSTVSKEAPLVMRRYWQYESIKLFYYSADSAIEVREGAEGSQGMIKTIEDLKNKPALQTNTHLGMAVRYQPVKEFSEGGVIAFSPQDDVSASVSLVISHPKIPIKISPYQSALRIVLNKGEHVLVEPFIDAGELNSMTVKIGGTSNHTSFSYNSK